MPTNFDYDVIIGGAGAAGCIAAFVLGTKGYKVGLFETKPKARIGEKICGDALGDQVFSDLALPQLPSAVILRRIKGGLLYSPDLTSIELNDKSQAGFILDRHEFGQTLLSWALKTGTVELLDEHTILQPLLEKDHVTGIRVRDKKTKQEKSVTAPVVIDCCGYATPIRPHIPDPMCEPSFNEAHDSIICYREILEFSEAGFNHPVSPHHIGIFLDVEKAPGGYIWYFPRTDNTANIGFGVSPQYSSQIKTLFKNNVRDRFVGQKSVNTLSSGGGIVSVRHPIWSAVSPGVMFAGDSALQVNPIHGGGLDPAIRAGYYAAETAIQVLESQDFSKRTLWNYNVRTVREFGRSFASLNVVRQALQSFSNRQIDYAMRNQMLSAQEILEICESGKITFDPFYLLSKILWGALNPFLFGDLVLTFSKMKRISAIYSRFPSIPEEFPAWQRKAEREFTEISELLRPSR